MKHFEERIKKLYGHHNYSCATINCKGWPIELLITSKPTAFYGQCKDHRIMPKCFGTCNSYVMNCFRSGRDNNCDVVEECYQEYKRR